MAIHCLVVQYNCTSGDCCLASDTCRVRWLPWSRWLLCSSSAVLGLSRGGRLSLEQCLSLELSSVRPSTCMHASRCVCKSSRIVVHSAVNVSSRCCLFVVHPRGRLGLRLYVLLGSVAKSERKETGVVNDITKMYNHEVGGLGAVSGQRRFAECM